MDNIKLYMYFYKSTLLINWSSSLFFTIISVLFTGFSIDTIVYGFVTLSMTLGFFMALLIKDSSYINKNEYYFYYNAGISKIKLIIFSSVLNILSASLILIGYSYGKQYITY